MDALATAQDIDGRQDLYREHAGPLVEWLAASHHDWTIHSSELLQFVVVVNHAGELPKLCNVALESLPGRGTWVAQVMISQFVSSSPTSGSVLTAQSLELLRLVCVCVCVSLSAPPPRSKQKRKEKKVCQAYGVYVKPRRRAHHGLGRSVFFAQSTVSLQSLTHGVGLCGPVSSGPSPPGRGVGERTSLRQSLCSDPCLLPASGHP